ncbi:MAG: enoyl-CoA hydratase/isomerase family protein [bacterium]
MQKLDTVNYAVDQGVCTIQLNRPDSLNAMNRQLIEDTATAFDLANQDEEVKVIVLTGAGRAFCAGDDRNQHVHPQDRKEPTTLVDSIQRVTRSIVGGKKLVVGAINGWAVGGGFEWAINCDFPIWAQSARGFFPEVSLNLFVTGGVTSLLPAIVGLTKAREMLFLGQQYSAQSLHEMGIAWKVEEDKQLMDRATEVAQKLAGLPTLSSQAMKRVLNQTAITGIESAMALETEATVNGFMDPETTRLLKDF